MCYSTSTMRKEHFMPSCSRYGGAGSPEAFTGGEENLEMGDSAEVRSGAQLAFLIFSTDNRDQ